MTQDQIAAPSGFCISTGRQMFLRCNGKEIPGLRFISRHFHFPGVTLVFPDQPALGEPGAALDLEFYQDDKTVARVAATLVAVDRVQPVGEIPRYEAEIELVDPIAQP